MFGSDRAASYIPSLEPDGRCTWRKRLSSPALAVIVGMLASGSLQQLAPPLAAQGMALPARQPRGSKRARTGLPVPAVRLEDVAAQVGLVFQHVSGPSGPKEYIPETTGAGAALFDYDNDGRLDVLLVNGSKWSYPEGEKPATTRLFHNSGDLELTDVTEEAGLAIEGWGQGVCVGDFDNDGNRDLFLTQLGRNVLLRNRGNGSFEDVSERSGLAAGRDRWGTGCSFFDYDRDGDLDLAVANYLVFDREKTPRPGDSYFCEYKGLSVVCGPRGLPGESNLLYRNEGGGVFTDVSETSGFSKVTDRYGFSVLTSDFDGDGWTDVYIACDSTPSILFHNERDGTFRDVGLESGAALSEDGQEQAGMGVDAADFDHDGLLDIVKTNFAEDVVSLYKNAGEGFFTDVSYPAGLGVNTAFVGWGVGFVDLDHDGWDDILIVNGHVYPGVDQLDLGAYRQPKVVYWNLRNGAFLDISAQSGPAIRAPQASRGAAFGDLDNDGSVEVVVNNLDSPPSLLVNRTQKMGWLLVELRGTTSNRDGIGARVTLTSGDAQQVKEPRSGGSFLSQNDLRLHFGLGSEAQADRVEVRWLGGEIEAFGPFEKDQIVRLTQGSGTRVDPVAGLGATEEAARANPSRAGPGIGGKR